MANASYLKIFSFTFSLHLVGRKIPDSVSNYLPSCLSKFDPLSFTFNFVLSKLSVKECYMQCGVLKSNEDMILALAGQFQQLSHEPEKFR